MNGSTSGIYFQPLSLGGELVALRQTITVNDESYAGEKFHGLLDFIIM